MIKFLRWLADQDIFNFYMYAVMNFTAQEFICAVKYDIVLATLFLWIKEQNN